MTAIDLQSFILGMGLVLVIALVVVSVMALVKVMRLERQKNNVDLGFQQQIDDSRTNFEHMIENVYRDMDSRLDKLYNKIIQDTNPKQRILNMINNKKTEDNIPSDKD